MLGLIQSIFISISALSTISNSNYISYSSSKVNEAKNIITNTDFVSLSEEDSEGYLKYYLLKYFDDADKNDTKLIQLETYLFNNDPFFKVFKYDEKLGSEFRFEIDDGGGSGSTTFVVPTLQKITSNASENGVEHIRKRKGADCFGIYIDKDTATNIYNKSWDIFSTALDIGKFALDLGELIQYSEAFFITSISAKFSPIIAKITSSLITVCRTLAIVMMIVCAACLLVIVTIWWAALRGKGVFYGFVYNGNDKLTWGAHRIYE